MDSSLLKAHPEYRAHNKPGAPESDEDGAVWPCPAREEVKEYELSICREMLERYSGISRLHLDYIRYPWSGGSIYSCTSCQKTFQRKTGFNLLTDITGGGGATGPGFDAFLSWRCGHIRDFVARAKQLATSTGVELSAAVFPFYPSILFDLGQDWVDWGKSGLLDRIYVMNYNRSAAMVKRYASMHAHFLSDRPSMIHQGLWISPDMSSAEVHALIQAGLEDGAGGITFFTGDSLAEMPADILHSYESA